VSRERAQRRAERAQRTEREDAARAKREQRLARRRATRQALRDRVPQRTRWHGQQGILARRRRRQNGLILLVLIVSQSVVWLLTGDPWLRVTAALLALLATPVLVTLVLDRRA
jgi:Flp pilus assembly protein TadB